MVCVCAIGARSPGPASARLKFFGAVLALAAVTSVQADVHTYNGQLRRVNATIQGPRPNTTQTLVAPDFNPWSATAVAMRSVNGNPNNVAQASQVSSFEDERISMYGSVSLQDNNPTDGGLLFGTTSMQISFAVHEAQSFVLHGTTASSEEDRSTFQVRLAGPSGFLLLHEADDGYGDYLFRGTLAPGSYFLTALFEHSLIDTPSTGASMGSITTILTVPSPGIPVAFACFGLLTRRRR